MEAGRTEKFLTYGGVQKGHILGSANEKRGEVWTFPWNREEKESR